LEILSEIKEAEELLKEGPEEKGFIIEKAFNASEPTKPIRFRLANVQNKDKYDEVMRIMGIANTTEKPESYSCVSKYAKGKKSGIDLWNSLQNYRATICKILVESSSNDSVKYKFVDPKINQFETQESLKAEILKQFSSKKWIVNKSDSSMVSDIYIALTKREMVKNEHEKGKMEHWIGKTFNHAPAVGALASLSSLQKEILTARADAITIIKGRIGGGDYSFNSIVALATPKFAVVQPGAEIELEVRMAAYDSDRQPEIKPNQGTLKSTANGVGLVTARATNGKMEFTGTVSISDKYGAQKTEKYTTVVQVAAGGGALEMPEYLVLYQGYDNFVVPSLAGALDANLSAPGCSVTKTTRDGKKGYIVKPGAGVKLVTMSVSGKGGDGKAVKGISNTYKVKRFPQAVVKSSVISKSMGAQISVGLPGDSPLRAPSFVVRSVELNLGDNNPTFQGPNIPGSAISKLKVGKKIGISVIVYNPITKSSDPIPGELKITN
jgi:hypothetical protein